jgi:hypothetical protein
VGALTGRRQVAVYLGSTPTASKLSLWLDNTGMRPVLRYYRTAKSSWRNALGGRVVKALGNVSAGFTLPDPDDANLVTATLTANVAIAMPSGGSQGDELLVYLTQGTGGSKVPTLTGAQWPGGTVPTWSTVAGKTDKVRLVNWNGTNYEGFASIDIR